jgi:hypothetical protein
MFGIFLSLQVIQFFIGIYWEFVQLLKNRALYYNFFKTSLEGARDVVICQKLF